MAMKRSMFYILIVILAFIPRALFKEPRHFEYSTQVTKGSLLRAKVIEYKVFSRGLTSRIGSTPPSCEHKCGGCIPCIPFQFPTSKYLLSVQYANYRPEGWKCKCHNSYFNP